MLRSSRDLRRGQPPTVRPTSAAAPAPPAAVRVVDEEVDVHLAAAAETTAEPGSPAKVDTGAAAAAQAYEQLAQAADAIYAAARAGTVPDGPEIVAAVRAIVRELAQGDALLTESVRRRPEAEAWSRRSVNVAIMAMRLGRELDFDERRTLALGLCALTHDLGMLEVPDEALASKRLTPKQLQSLQQHPIASERLVRGFGKAFEWVAKVVVQVHERRDGSGYPAGLKGDDIHEFASIIGLVDTYEAMAHPRVDREARVIYNALKEIIDLRNSIFDRRLIKALINIVSIFPLGSLVKLNNGEIGRVVATSRLHPTRPTVDILLDARSRALSTPRQTDLQDEPMLYIVDPAIEEGVLSRR